MTRQQWRTRGTQNKNKLRVVTAPGKCISINQLEAPVQGFIRQLKGKLTKRQYGVTTIFVDHASQLSYVHLQSRVTAEETVEAFWGIRKVTRCDSQTLPCRQWPLRRKPLHECGCWIGTNNLFLQSQCSFSKCHSGETDSRHVRTSKETTPTCKCKMAISNQNQSMAICTLQCKWHSEHNCRQRRWELTSREILSNQSPSKVKTQSHIWVPRLCTQLSPPRWESSSQVESKSKTWH
jgi:hypothetical protein